MTRLYTLRDYGHTVDLDKVQTVSPWIPVSPDLQRGHWFELQILLTGREKPFLVSSYFPADSELTEAQQEAQRDKIRADLITAWGGTAK